MNKSIELIVPKNDIKNDILHSTVHKIKGLTIYWRKENKNKIKIKGEPSKFEDLATKLNQNSTEAHNNGQYEYKRANLELNKQISKK